MAEVNGTDQVIELTFFVLQHVLIMDLDASFLDTIARLPSKYDCFEWIFDMSFLSLSLDPTSWLSLHYSF